MNRRVFSTSLRLNLDRPEERRAWERLQNMDRARFRSYTQAVVTAVNDYFDRMEQQETPDGIHGRIVQSRETRRTEPNNKSGDSPRNWQAEPAGREGGSFLESREKEDAFLRRVLEVVERGLASAGSRRMIEFLPPTGEAQALPPQTSGVSPEDTAEKRELDAAALAFLDSL